jgi:glyoxylase-like metal-dependent hydrolase (beta-lactamase superfamily II)
VGSASGVVVIDAPRPTVEVVTAEVRRLGLGPATAVVMTHAHAEHVELAVVDHRATPLHVAFLALVRPECQDY